MKKLIYTLVAFTLIAVSCQREFDALDYEGNDAVAVTISVGIPELDATRANQTAMNSGKGAITNFGDDEWNNKYDLRYILEIYEEGYENFTKPVKTRDVQILDSYKETMFAVRLVPNRKYRFVVWADFVNQGADASDNTNDDLNYDTSNLQAITRKSAPVAMDECQDAYFIAKDLVVDSNGINETLTLKRPFGKIRVITTDYNEVNIGSDPKMVEVTFYNHPIYKSLNAVTGKTVGNDVVGEYTYTFDVAKDSPYTLGYDKEPENMTLFADYILTGDMGAQEVNFKIKVTGKDNRVINSHDFNTQIPLERNKLTTIIGNLLTTKNNITIRIDDNFDGEYVVDNLWDGKYENLPAANAEGWIEIATPGQLATLLNSDADGMKVRLIDDVNFDGTELKLYRDGVNGSNKPFELDGNGKVISNFTVSNGEAAGLFTDLTNAYIHNLTIKNAFVAPNASTRASTDFYAGALVGRTYGVCQFSDIKVVDCQIEGVNKVGGLIGFVAEGSVALNNCVVESSTVGTKSTDDGGCVGGLVGYIASSGTLIENSSVLSTVINAINSANEAKRANAEFIGAFDGNGKVLTLKGNTCKDNTFNQETTSYVAPDGLYPWLGGIRYNTPGTNVIVDGASITTPVENK